jgi:broad specificity phosphatase PhoE
VNESISHPARSPRWVARKDTFKLKLYLRGAMLPQRSASDLVSFLGRNLTPRSLFANIVAFLWIIAVSAFVRWLKRRMHAPGPAMARLEALGLATTAAGELCFGAGSPVTHEAKLPAALETMIMVPHGRTPSNEKLLFQSHEEGPNATLLPASLEEAAAGAEEFWKTWYERFREHPSDFIFLRSPLHRTAQTAQVYMDTLLRLDANGCDAAPSVQVDAGLLEINHASWHGCCVDDLAGADRAAAEAYRNGSFFAAPSDGESNLDLLERCSAWLSELRHGVCASKKVIVVFGHGTYQNAVETLLRTYGTRKTPAGIFSRKPGASHLRRGRPHSVWPPVP